MILRISPENMLWRIYSIVHNSSLFNSNQIKLFKKMYPYYVFTPIRITKRNMTEVSKKYLGNNYNAKVYRTGDIII